MGLAYICVDLHLPSVQAVLLPAVMILPFSRSTVSENSFPNGEACTGDRMLRVFLEGITERIQYCLHFIVSFMSSLK